MSVYSFSNSSTFCRSSVSNPSPIFTNFNISFTLASLNVLSGPWFLVNKFVGPSLSSASGSMSVPYGWSSGSVGSTNSTSDSPEGGSGFPKSNSQLPPLSKTSNEPGTSSPFRFTVPNQLASAGTITPFAILIFINLPHPPIFPFKF
ncbi:hypothetical protein VKT23_015878 [Stygiomarasmius scandens]|uniref:Uncharacterized protein n=1 Tax=Marasmiellus scandens TaxID=2682957 RepID=A0ABR1IWG1_9AGAR